MQVKEGSGPVDVIKISKSRIIPRDIFLFLPSLASGILSVELRAILDTAKTMAPSAVASSAFQADSTGGSPRNMKELKNFWESQVVQSRSKSTVAAKTKEMQQNEGTRLVNEHLGGYPPQFLQTPRKFSHDVDYDGLLLEAKKPMLRDAQDVERQHSAALKEIKRLSDELGHCKAWIKKLNDEIRRLQYEKSQAFQKADDLAELVGDLNKRIDRLGKELDSAEEMATDLRERLAACHERERILASQLKKETETLIQASKDAVEKFRMQRELNRQLEREEKIMPQIGGREESSYTTTAEPEWEPEDQPHSRSTYSASSLQYPQSRRARGNTEPLTRHEYSLFVQVSSSQVAQDNVDRKSRPPGHYTDSTVSWKNKARTNPSGKGRPRSHPSINTE